MSDESFYAAALHEYESGNADAGLRAKAYVAADGVENRIKLEYIKLRVKQLKGRSRGSSTSLRSWYSNTSKRERVIYLVISAVLSLFLVGLIPLAMLMWLQASENDDLARQVKQHMQEQQSTQTAAKA